MTRSELRQSRDELRAMVRASRWRWRLRIALRGLALTLACAVVAFLASGWAVDRMAFAPGGLLFFRVLVWTMVGIVGVRWLLLPLARRLADQRVALYLEEREPTIGAALVSAMEVTDDDAPDRSPAFDAVLIRSALQRLHAVDDGRRVERPALLRSWGMLAAAGIGTIVILGMMPSGVRHGAGALLRPWTPAEAANPYAVLVTPGDTTIARGGDFAVTASLVGFASERVELLVRREGEAGFERVPMIPPGDSAGAWEAVVFDLDVPAEYAVESSGIRSAVHRVDVADLPVVERLVLEYRFPQYTGLPPRVVEAGGDIAVLGGTEVVVRAFASLSPPGGTVLLEPTDSVALAPVGSEGALEGSFTVREPGFYRIELEGPEGPVPASPRYSIEVLEDMPPTVSFETPGRDTRATAIEEVYVEARAQDDYGVASLELVYSVNGGEEQKVPLFGGGRRLGDVSAGHTFYLEELPLEPGDFVTYHARASDGRAGGSGDAVSDIYFVQIRAFRKDYRQADAAPPPGGGGGEMGGADEALSEQQRQIVAGTFNVVRDSARYGTTEVAQNLVTLRLAQERLREQVGTLVERMRNRGVAQADSGFLKILEMLPVAAAFMDTAAVMLEAGRPSDAMGPEQRALQQLLRAEEVYREVQVAMQQQGGGGGGGGGPNAEDLADLFELELDKLQNQYETLQRGERQQADQQVDELMERLKELARRQQQEAERRRAAARQGQQSSGGSASQQRLAQETEEAARQLERLAREQRQPELERLAQELQQTADEMRRAAASQGAEGSAGAEGAADRLREAQRRLQREQTSRLERDAADARRRAERIASEQREIQSEVGSLPASGAERARAVREIQERKERLASDVADLERDLDAMAGSARGSRDEAADELSEAAGGIRDSKLKEALLYSRGVVEQYPPEQAEEFERRQITPATEQLAERMREAEEAVRESGSSDPSEALDRARDLVRGAESLSERLGEASERRGLSERPGDQRGQQGQEGQPQGQQGQQQGQPGGQGQQGDPSQEGQQGGAQARGGTPAGGSPTGPGAGSPPRGLSPEEARQFQREFAERLGDARALAEELRRQGVDPARLEGVMDAMRELASADPYARAAELAELRTAVLEGLKEFEYGLRRELAGAGERPLFLSGSDDVPEGFRELVEEYYRRLAGWR